MKKFGVLAPTMGLRLDMPSILLSEAATPECLNVRFENGEAVKAKMRSVLLSTDTDQASPNDTLSDTILLYHLHRTWAGAYWLLAFTADKIYRWDEDYQTWDLYLHDNLLNSGASRLTETTTWSVVSFNNKVFATNGQSGDYDKILSSDMSTKFQPHGAAAVDEGGGVYSYAGIQIGAGPDYLTGARFLTVFQGYLMAGNTTEGGSRPSRLRWCAINDDTEWDSGDASYNDIPGNDALMYAAMYRDNLILFKQRSIRRMWFSPGDADLIFPNDLLSAEYGSEAMHSYGYLNDGTLVYIASDKTVRDIHGRELSRSVYKYFRGITNSAIDGIRCFRVDEYQELWWSIPYEQSANNCIMVLDRDGRWTTLLMNVRAFGKYTRTSSYTIDTIPFDTIDEWAWDSIDSVEGTSGFFTDICSVPGGQSCALHQSVTDIIPAYSSGKLVISTDLSQQTDLIGYKRIYEIELLSKTQQGGEVDAAFSYEGDEYPGIALGTFSLDGVKQFTRSRIPCNIRTRQIYLSFTSSSPFRIYGIILHYVDDGVA